MRAYLVLPILLLAPLILLCPILPSAEENISPAVSGKTISGSCTRLFPAILSLDYSFCRAAAWLDALKNAEKSLPEDADIRLRQMGLDILYGRLGLCAYIFPVEIVTSENSSSDEVRVFLRYDENYATRLDNILEDTQFLILEALYVTETRDLVRQMRESWPHNLAEARENIASLENGAEELDAFWQLRVFMEAKKDDVALVHSAMLNLESIAAICKHSVLARLLLAEFRLDSHLTQGALAAAEDALVLCRNAELDRGAKPLLGMWRLVEANILYIRAIAHMRLHQTALAAMDLEMAENILLETVQGGGLLVKVLLAHAELERTLQNTTGMCDYLRRACAAGSCGSLAHARRTGQCNDSAGEH